MRKHVLVCGKVQLFSAMERQSRNLKAMDNPKIWKKSTIHCPINPATYSFSENL
jgi:hypothetical protein